MQRLLCVYKLPCEQRSLMSWGHERSLLAGICLLMILIPVKGSHIVQPRYQKRENAVSLPKISINILTFPRGLGLSREMCN